MKIIFLTPHTRISGGVKAIFNLAQGLLDRGCSVSVYARKYLPEQLRSWISTSVPVHELDEHETLPNCDFVVNYGDGNPFLGIPAGAKHILFMQNFGIHDPAQEKLALLYPYNRVIVVSKWLADIAQAAGHNVFVVHPGLDRAYMQHSVPSVYPETLYVGSLWHKNSWKNASLFEASMLVLRRRIAVKPLLVTSRPTIIQSFEDNGLSYSLAVDPPQVLLPSVYNCCPVWVSPSTREGFGLTTLEAMACGCAVVTVRQLGLNGYLQNGKNCILVKNDKEAIATAVQNLTANKALRAEIAKNGRLLACQFTWQKSVENFYKALQ